MTDIAQYFAIPLKKNYIYISHIFLYSMPLEKLFKLLSSKKCQNRCHIVFSFVVIHFSYRISITFSLSWKVSSKVRVLILLGSCYFALKIRGNPFLWRRHCKERVPLVMMLRNLSFSFQFQENAGKYLNSAYICKKGISPALFQISRQSKNNIFR